MRNARPLFSASSMTSATYVACLDCGKEFPYNWHEMRVEKYAVPQAAASLDVNAVASRG